MSQLEIDADRYVSECCAMCEYPFFTCICGMEDLLVCPYCGEDARLVDSGIIYGRSYGPAWVCSNYPECDAYVGCHKGTVKPLGRLANAELREWKKRAHAAFDLLWKEQGMDRKEAYKMLAQLLGIRKRDCHIGRFDVEQCKRTVEVLEAVTK